MIWVYIVLGIIGVAVVLVIRNAQADPRNRARR